MEKKWDRYQACKILGIPVRVYEHLHDENVLGSNNLYFRCIHIRKDHENDDRVWIHELAHAMLHFRKYEVAAVIGDQVKNAMAELEADTVAYIVAKTLGCEDRKDYLKYMTMFMSRIPADMQSVNILDERMPYLLKTADLILKSGGYYA